MNGERATQSWHTEWQVIPMRKSRKKIILTLPKLFGIGMSTTYFKKKSHFLCVYYVNQAAKWSSHCMNVISKTMLKINVLYV